MRLQRHGIVTLLTAAALALASAASAEAPPTYDRLFQQASAAYGGSDPARCVELFKAAANAAARPGGGERVPRRRPRHHR